MTTHTPARTSQHRGRRALAFGLVAAVTLALASCGSDSGDGSEGDAGAFTLGVYPLYVSMPAWVAEEEGMFEENGLDVELKTILSGPTMISALQSKSIDAMLNGATIAETVRSKGQPVKLVTTTIPSSIYNMVATPAVTDGCPHADKPFPEPILCTKGKRIGVVALGSESHIAGISLLQQAGMAEDDVTWIPASAGEMIGNSMKAGQIDVMLAEDTAAIYATQIAKVGTPLVDLKKDGPFADWFGNGVWALEPQLEASPDEYQAFVAAIEDAVDWISDPANQEAARAVYQKYSPTTSKETIEAVVAASTDYFGTTVNCSGLEQIAGWLAETGQTSDASAPGSCRDIAWQTAELS